MSKGKEDTVPAGEGPYSVADMPTQPRPPPLAGGPSEADQDLGRRRISQSAPIVSREDAELVPGTAINHRYTIERRLGKGGSGVVYKVIDQIHPERPIALKTLRGSTVSRETIDRFKSEFKTMTALYHPHVARAYDFEPIHGTDDYLMTLEYVEGRDIYTATENQGWRWVVDLVVDVCRALAYMHSRGIVHFDLKPPHIIVDPMGAVKILDFGIAGPKPTATPLGIVGTPAYMAPEAGLDIPSIDHRYDLYSLGIILYRLLARRPPFAAPTPRELFRLNCFAPIVFDEASKERTPEWLRKIVEKLCEKHPSNRYRNANAVIEAINEQGRLSYPIETQETTQSYTTSSRFVGRRREFSKVLSFMQGRLRGTSEAGPVLFIAGDSGIGKSRLMREVRYEAQIADLPFVEVNCYQQIGSEFGPIMTVLDHLVRVAETLEAKALLEKVKPILARRSPKIEGASQSPTSSQMAAVMERRAEVELMSEFLIEMSSIHPYALYINDLHWARSGTIEVLCEVLSSIACSPQRIAIIASYRDGEMQGTPMESLVQTAARSCSTQVIQLKPLDSAEVRDLLGSMLGTGDVPAALADRLFEETEGNPYFVEEVMRVLVESGVVFPRAGKWASSVPVGDLPIPQLSDVFLARAALLGRHERSVLEALAICEQPVSSELLQAITGLQGGVVNDALQILLQRHMAKRTATAHPTFQMRHDRMRTSLTRSLDAARSQALCLSVARAYETVYAASPHEYLYELAYYYGRSGADDKALEYNLPAERKATQAYEFELAIRFVKTRLEILTKRGEQGGARWQESMEALGELHFKNGNLEDAERVLTGQLSVSTATGDKVRVLSQLAEVLRERGDLDGSGRRLWEALGLLGKSRAKSKLGLYLRLGWTVAQHIVHRAFPFAVRQAGTVAEKDRIATLARLFFSTARTYFHSNPLELLLSGFSLSNLMDRDRGGDPAMRVEGELYLGVIYMGIGRNFTASRFIDSGARRAQTAGLDRQAAMADAYLSLLAYMQGDWDRCISLSERCMEKFLRWGDFMNYGAVSTNIFNPLFYRGQLERTRELTRAVERVKARTGKLLFGNFCSIHVLVLRMMLDGEDVEAEAASLERELADGQLWLLVGDLLYRMADVYLQRGDFARSIRYGEKLEQELIRKRSFYNGFFMIIRGILARAYVEELRNLKRGDPRAGALRRKAHRSVESALRVSQSFPIYRWSAELARGELLHLEGQYPRSRQAFVASIEEATKLGANLWLAQAHFGTGRCLVESPATRAAGLKHLQEALRIFRASGAIFWVERIEPLMRGVLSMLDA